MSDRAVERLEKLIEIARQHFSPERFQKVEALHEFFAERLIIMPASSKEDFHCCYPGGYLDHVHNVITSIMHMTKVLKDMGGEVNFTQEEAIFAAMHHDLGKVGDLNHPYYVPQDSDWHYERGQRYKINPDLPFMSIQDRSLYLLQHFDIEMSQKEWTAIRVHDGLFVEGNKPYFISYSNPVHMPVSNLQYVLHMADWMADITEGDRHRRFKREKDEG
jgi:hypothetical protein